MTRNFVQYFLHRTADILGRIRGVAKEGGGEGGRSPPNCLQNRPSKKFKSGEILRRRGREASNGTFLRHSQNYYTCMCVMLLLHQISAREISSKTRVRRREIAFPSSRNPKFSRGSTPRTPRGGSWLRHLMFAPPNIHLWLHLG